MNILFYSSNSNFYSEGKLIFNMLPSAKNQWNALKEKYPQLEFTVVMQKPGMFLYDDDGSALDDDGSFKKEIEISGKEREAEVKASVKYVFVPSSAGAADFAKIILEQKPDIAIAVTYWTQPFDWMSIKDSMIGEELTKLGIKTVCHPAAASEICFDKWKTHQFLEQHGFLCAKGVYVHHEMFYAERNRNVIETNIYKDYVFSEIRKLRMPVVIKDTLGLSSFGMDVVHTFEEARHVLLSKKNNGDRLVEEFLSGDSYGIEVYGSKGNYTVTLPLINSVNQFGLTSPKQNVKLGPAGISEEQKQKLNIPELQSEIRRLAELLNLNGMAQIDLLLSGGKWYIIEINSRISGMTQTMAASAGLSLYELILFSAGILPENENISEKSTSDTKLSYSYVMNLKFPLLSSQVLSRLSSKPYVYAVNQIENREAKQLREVGYTEVIFGQTETLEETMKMLEELNEEFPDVMEPVFYKNAGLLAERLR